MKSVTPAKLAIGFLTLGAMAWWGIDAYHARNGHTERSSPTHELSGQQLAMGRAVLQSTLIAMEVPAARKLASGANVAVAIIDTGIDRGTKGLASRVTRGFDVRTGGPADGDVGEHGTAMATLVAGRPTPLGTEGVAPGVVVVPIRAAFGFGSDARSIGAALRWGATRAKVVLLAYAPAVWDKEVVTALEDAASGGTVVVVAGGNRGQHNKPPPTDAVLTVGAVDSSGSAESYSGPAGNGGVVAPGGAADPHGKRLLSMGPRKMAQTVAGTSVSAALVAGVVALVRSANPSLTPKAVVDCVRRTALDLGPPGVDENFGHGEVVAVEAVRCALSRQLHQP